MADLEPYKLSMTGAEADSGIRTGMEAGEVNGVLFGDGAGGVRAATPGTDFGFALLRGNGPPTGDTAGDIGQHYFDMSATSYPYEYICVGFGSSGFVWRVFGDTGNNFIVNGFFSSLEALEQAISEELIPAPTPGVAYGIGAAAPYMVYVWDSVFRRWTAAGELNGSPGAGGGGIPPHGTRGQALIKASNVDYDAGWLDIAKSGSGAPTALTPATYVGQLYVDTSAADNPAYICTAITADADSGEVVYTWEPCSAPIAPGSIGSTELASFSVTLDKIASSAFDEAPTEDSNKLIRSGAVYEAINSKKPVLVWTNASPSSNFAAQNLNLNLSGYTFVDIAFSVVKGASPPIAKIARVPVNGRRTTATMFRYGQAADTVRIIQRDCTASSTQIEFGGGSSKVITASTVSADDQYAIPLWVWAV